MNLDQLLKLENIKDYYILWYGADIADKYMNDEGMVSDTVELNKGKPGNKERVYIFLSGIDKKTCRYRFAGKLHPGLRHPRVHVPAALFPRGRPGGGDGRNPRPHDGAARKA